MRAKIVILPLAIVLVLGINQILACDHVCSVNEDHGEVVSRGAYCSGCECRFIPKCKVTNVYAQGVCNGSIKFDEKTNMITIFQGDDKDCTANYDCSE